jgi:hypothetical protein
MPGAGRGARPAGASAPGPWGGRSAARRLPVWGVRPAAPGAVDSALTATPPVSLARGAVRSQARRRPSSPRGPDGPPWLCRGRAPASGCASRPRAPAVSWRQPACVLRVRQPRLPPCAGHRAVCAAWPVHGLGPTSGAPPAHRAGLRDGRRPSSAVGCLLPWEPRGCLHAQPLSVARPLPRRRGEASRGTRSSRRCTDAGCIKPRPVVDGGRRGCVPARPDGPTPQSRCGSLAPHLRSTLPADAPSRKRPGAALVLRLHAYLDRGRSPPSMTACTAHTLPLSCGRNAGVLAVSSTAFIGMQSCLQ